MKLLGSRRLLALSIGAIATPIVVTGCGESQNRPVGSIQSPGCEGAGGGGGSTGCGGSDGTPGSGGDDGNVGGGKGGSAAGGAGGQGSGGSTTGPGPGSGGSTTGAGSGGGGGQSGPSAYTSGSRLRAREYDGGGDARVFLGWQDTELNEKCQFHTTGDGTVRCLPEADSRAFLRYLDNDCTQPVGVRACGSQAQYITAQTGPSGCETGTEAHTVYQLGAARSSAMTYTLLGSNCVGKPADPTIVLHDVTEVPASAFVAATSADEPHDERLALRVLTGEDGSRETRHLRDTQLGISCTAQQAAADEQRCLPESTLMAGAYFSDSGCHAPVLVRTDEGSGCPTPAYALSQGLVPSCTPTIGVVSVGVPLSSTSIYQGSAQSCTMASFLPDTWSFFVQGLGVEASTFVQLRQPEVGSGRLHASFTATADGQSLLAPLAFRDNDRGVPCAVRTFADGSQRCVPQNVAMVKVYKNAQCNVPLITFSVDDTQCTPAPTEVILTEPQPSTLCGAGPIAHVHGIGTKFTGPKVYRKGTNGSCTMLDAVNLQADIYELGPELQPDVFAAVTEIVD